MYFTSIRKEKGERFTTCMIRCLSFIADVAYKSFVLVRFKVICDDGTVLHVES